MSTKSKIYKNSPKKIYIRTFGCQMNERDSEWMLGHLLSCGWETADNPQNASLAIINTCSVRYHAEHKAFSLLGFLRKIKNENGLKIVLTGCTADAYKEKLLKDFPYLDGVFGPAEEKELIERIDELFSSNKSMLSVGKQTGIKCFNSGSDYRKEKITAFVSIMEGCDNFCSYCIVPYVRGRERSRETNDILDEIHALKEKGYKEVMLLGQNVNSYGVGNKNGFIKLLEEVNAIGIERIRFMTSHPKDINLDLLKAMKDLEHVCEHLHLPLQSGSDKILRLMNRKYILSDYLKLVNNYRKIIPSGSITTDIIVGFPGESTKDFKRTLFALNQIKFDSAFIFKYSPRPNTAANGFVDDVGRKEKEARNLIALSIQKEISFRKKMKWIDKNLEVLLERKDSEGFYKGRSSQNFTVHAKGSALEGVVKNVRINEARINSLRGEIIE
ncbi:MAG: tRNA (N6-isopentenyl adenosine(37)-C2)-methylthiotransferase MiaB [Candidatus Saelkia tenebricola]|nr:tRNA (N6-isopentenyl adenosine(37)-C2)-methylthiotransferase MiaB [Candidatus Saelkia tenebricola]